MEGRKMYKKSFTLVELLVVIAIIGILASIIAVATMSAKVNARDARRIADVDAIKTAVELYGDLRGNFQIQTKSGGITGLNTANGGMGSWGWVNCKNANYINSIAEGLESWGLIGKTPTDPMFGNSSCTRSSAGGDYMFAQPYQNFSKYCIYAHLDKKAGTNAWDTRGVQASGTNAADWNTNYGMNYAVGAGCNN